MHASPASVLMLGAFARASGSCCAVVAAVAAHGSGCDSCDFARGNSLDAAGTAAPAGEGAGGPVVAVGSLAAAVGCTAAEPAVAGAGAAVAAAATAAAVEAAVAG